MKKSNEIIQIGGETFIVTPKGKHVLRTHLKSMKRKNRLDKNARKELENALRDVLIEIRPNATATLSLKKINEAILIIGDSYDSHKVIRNLWAKLTTTARRSMSIVSTRLTEKNRKRMYYVLTGLTLLPIGVTISSLSVIQSSPVQFSPVYSNTYDSTIGTVTLGNYFGNLKKPFEYNGTSNDTSTYMLIAVLLLLFVFLVSLAHRWRYTALIGAMLVTTFVTSFGISQNEQAVFEQTARLNGLQSFVSPPLDRDADDFDTLSVCNVQIQFIELSSTAGDMYYALKDKGFELVDELETEGFSGVPEREQICTAYDQLRKSYTSESIVLQSFVRDETGNERPYDYLENANRSSNNRKELKLRYGFYVRD